MSNLTTNNYNHISDQTFWDLSLKYNISYDGQWTVYGNIINMFDRLAPLNSVQPAFYDTLGRTFNVGIRVNF